jgi:hypothetical protein
MSHLANVYPGLLLWEDEFSFREDNRKRFKGRAIMLVIRSITLMFSEALFSVIYIHAIYLNHAKSSGGRAVIP